MDKQRGEQWGQRHRIHPGYAIITVAQSIALAAVWEATSTLCQNGDRGASSRHCPFVMSAPGMSTRGVFRASFRTISARGVEWFFVSIFVDPEQINTSTIHGASRKTHTKLSSQPRMKTRERVDDDGDGLRVANGTGWTRTGD